ncbi:MAG: 23S rRNA (adenine(1618)-N(6))-methyltransferase RlmF [Spirochaetae bacterium HGW-Spirochaetae-5]|nr:MAG: 23S rRNA (adenine(1618)-N(6))-methyltransferase RlmF [Spirochaetae bacterium HGW-Spirochaetae-5]
MGKQDKKEHPPVKTGLHPRNPHRSRYDFKSLIESCAGLSEFVFINPYEDESINFADPAAVKMLNMSLLKHFYDISYWDIPDNYLCPPVPGRADYIHYIADLLGSCSNGIIPRGQSVSILDIGTGANCIYPIIGTHEYGWRFTGTDIDTSSIDSAREIIDRNARITALVELRHQKSRERIFHGIIRKDEYFDAAICNPPFHSSPEEAADGTIRKLNNLKLKNASEPVLNFGGQNNELWTPGGEEAFINRMIEESSEFSRNCLWFTTLISKKTTLPGVYKLLKRVDAAEVRTIDMAQGQKISRIVAWTFMDKNQQREWADKRWK